MPVVKRRPSRAKSPYRPNQAAAPQTALIRQRSLAARRCHKKAAAMSTAPLPITAAFHDKNLLGYGIRDSSTYQAWIVFLAALFGLPMTPQQ